MTEPRIPPIDPRSADDALAEALSSGEISGVSLADMNVFRTLAVHPRLLRRFMAMGGVLLQRGLLDPRERELLILRTAWLARCRYEWGQHVRISLDLGMGEEEIERVLALADWPDGDLALLRAADELHLAATLSDGTWEALAGSHTDAEMVEIVMLVGQYRMLAGAINAIGIELEPEFDHLAASFDRALADADQIR